MSVSVTNLGISGLEDIEQIGTGGSSRVYRARQTDLDRVVAVKVITAAHDKDVARRFDRERKAMGRLSLHEGIVPVYSTGTTTHGEPYLVMPYYDSGSLQDRIEAGPIDWPSAVKYVDVAAETMAAAHQAGVVHLDLKPANILLTDSGAPRVADFGIAKLTTGPVAKSAQTTSNPAFTPAYSAPETFLDGETGAESDVYGLGATLWALLVGHPPFLTPGEDTNLMAVIGRVVNNPVGDLRAIAPDSICEVIERAMAKQPEDRFQTASEFSEALKAASANEAANISADQTMLIPGVGNGASVPGAAPTGASLFADSSATQMIPSSEGPGPGPVPLPASMASTVSEPSQSAAASASSRPLLQETAQPLAKPMAQPVAPSPILDIDRFRLAPILLGLVAFLALIGLALFAFNAIGDDDSDGNVAISNPAAPETTLTDQDSTQLTSSVTAASSDATLSTAPTTATTVGQAPVTTAAVAATTEAEPATTEPEPTTTETTEEEPTTTETTEEEPTTTETTEEEPTTTETTEEPTTTDPVVETVQAPTGLTATPSADSVALSWSAPATGPDPSAYQVLRDGTEIAMIAGTSMSDSDVTAGETYAYTVRSVGEKPTDLSDPSAAATATVPEDVVELTANASTVRVGSGQITIRITASKCITYSVEAVQQPDGTPASQVVGPNGGAPCTDGGNVRIQGLEADTTYAITVTVNDGVSDLVIPTFEETTDS